MADIEFLEEEIAKMKLRGVSFNNQTKDSTTTMMPTMGPTQVAQVGNTVINQWNPDRVSMAQEIDKFINNNKEGSNNKP
jgi:hypothetical protein